VPARGAVEKPRTDEAGDAAYAAYEAGQSRPLRGGETALGGDRAHIGGNERPDPPIGEGQRQQHQERRDERPTDGTIRKQIDDGEARQCSVSVSSAAPL